MQLTKKQSFYLSLIHSAEHNKLSIREVAEQNNVNAVNLYAAVKTLREKGALPAAKEQRNFVKLSAPPLTHDLHIELKTQLPNGQAYGEAVYYTLRCWSRLTQYVGNGHIPH